NLAFQSGAFYVVQLNPLTAATTNVSGTATLNGGTVALIFSPGDYIRRSYTILTAAGGVSGTFHRAITLVQPPGFCARLSYPANTVVINLRAQLVPDNGGTSPQVPIPGLPTPTPPLNLATNQVSVGTAIDNFFNNGGTLPPAFAPLFNLGGSNLANAL